MAVRSDIVVIGSGPAGLAAAAACAERGLATVCLSPNPDSPWPQRFGAWASEAALLPPRAIAAEYTTPRVWLADDQGLALPRPYLRLDTPRLQEALRERAAAAGVRFEAMTVERADRTGARDDHPLSLVATDHRQVRCSLAIDASGASSKLLQRRRGELDAQQTAYGVVAEVRQSPYLASEMSFMDLRYTPPEGPGAAPSFLYALPLDDHHVFFEETSLVRSPGLPLHTLRERLAHRLKRSGVEVLSVLDEERCVIPMGLAPPQPEPLVVAFGAAAAMVHPATGYQLCQALRLAPALATILDEGLSSSSPEEACRRAANLVWPASRARLWALYRFGMAALCGFDLERTRAFFDSFYRLPTRDWTRYVDATASATEVGAIMVRLFLRTQPHLRLELLRHGLGPGRAELWRAASGAVS